MGQNKCLLMTDRLAAAGALEIAVVTILQPIHQHEKFPVFLIPLVGVAGKHAKQGNAHQGVGRQMHRQVEQGGLYKNRHRHNDHTGPQYGRVQLVVAVSPRHEPPKPVLESIHAIITL